TVACAGGKGVVVTFTESATDNVDPDPVVSCEPSSGSVFPPGSTTVVCTARDRSGNVATCSFVVSVGGSAGCPLSQGFWKNHPLAWPVGTLALGSVSYDQPALIALLARPVRGDASVILAKQLIAAKLNVANCASAPGIADQIGRADDLIGSQTL